jgi:ankyrin repeat protein
MPIDFAKTALLPRAFAPAPLETVNIQASLRELYGEEPYYGIGENQESGIRGTLAAGEEFTDTEKKHLDDFNKQIQILIKQFDTLHLQANHLQHLNTFIERIQLRNYYENQSSEFYKQIKEFLETITIKILDKNLNYLDKKRAIEDLLENYILFCGPGIFSYIKHAADLLGLKNTLETWLAKFRDTIIHQLANQHIKLKKIDSTLHVHVFNAFSLAAKKHGINQLGYETLTALNETHTVQAQFTVHDETKFHNDFDQAYNPVTVMTEIADTLCSQLTERITALAEQGKCIVITCDQLEKSLMGIPIIGTQEWKYACFNAFDEEEIVNSNQPYFNLDGSFLRLKSTMELRLALTKHFIDIDFRLFQGLMLEDKNQCQYGLVKQSTAICYVANKREATILPFSQAIFPFPIWHLRDFKIAINQQTFQKFLEEQESDFNHCVFDNISLLTIPTIENLNFANASFDNLHLFIGQYLYLAEHNCMLSKLYITDFLIHEIETILSKNNREKGFFLFIAVVLNNPVLITQLLAEDADTNVSLQNEIPLQCAVNYQHWECVKAFCAVKDDKTLDFGEALLKAAIHNQTDVVQALASRTHHTKVDGDKKTALHWAITHNNIPMLQALLAAKLDLSLKNHNSKTAIEYASEKKHWDCVNLIATTIKEQKNDFCYGSALICATLENKTDSVKILLDAGASTNWTTLSRTALHIAAANDNHRITGYLLTANANTEAENTDGKTPFDLTIENEAWECFKLLRQKTKTAIVDKKVREALLLYASNNNLRKVISLRSYYFQGPVAYYNAIDFEHNTTLHWAVIHNNTAMLNYHCDNISLKNIYNKSPLDIAIEKNYWGCVLTLSETTNDYTTFWQQLPHCLTEAETLSARIFQAIQKNYRERNTKCLRFFCSDSTAPAYRAEILAFIRLFAECQQRENELLDALTQRCREKGSHASVRQLRSYLLGEIEDIRPSSQHELLPV